jgi:hypothetical protein
VTDELDEMGNGPSSDGPATGDVQETLTCAAAAGRAGRAGLSASPRRPPTRTPSRSPGSSPTSWASRPCPSSPTPAVTARWSWAAPPSARNGRTASRAWRRPTACSSTVSGSWTPAAR